MKQHVDKFERPKGKMSKGPEGFETFADFSYSDGGNISGIVPTVKREKPTAVIENTKPTL
jgi:hypothetical protein